MIHLKILFHACALTLGIGSAVYLYLIQRAYRRPFLKPLLFFLVFNNVLHAVNLTSLYGCANLLGFCKGYGYTVLPTVLGPLARLSQWGILFSLAGVVQGFRGRRLSRAVQAGFAAGTVLQAAGYAVLGIAFSQGRFLRGLFRIQGTAFDLSVYASLALLLWLLALSFRSKQAAEARAMRALAIPYLAAYAVFLATLRLPTDTQFYPNAVMLLVVLGFPVFWIKRWFFAAYAADAGGDLETLAVERLCRDGNLTPRECEIVRLILGGKSNAEIEKSLFISVHTVKNHVTNILLKLGLKNRMQMIGRVRSLQNGIRSDIRLVEAPDRKNGEEIRIH